MSGYVSRLVEVVRHPAGGWTYAHPRPTGTAREYRGWWRSAALARAALKFDNLGRAA